MTEGTLDEIGRWVAAVETTAALTASATDPAHPSARRERALREWLNLLRVLTRRLFHRTGHDGDVVLFRDRSCGPHAVAGSGPSGLSGAVLLQACATGHVWSWHT